MAGSATISSPSATTTLINQTSNRAVINWNSFSIGSGDVTNFVQPSAASAILNRVMGSDPSTILGAIQSNGQVFLINPNGIVVGQGATINTAAFGASTFDVANAEFLAGGDLHFSGTSAAAVVNLGSINAQQGDVYLIAQQVTNAGALSAPNGTAVLAAGTEVTLTQNGSEHVLVTAPVNSAATGGSSAALLNSGTIQAARAELAAADGNLFALAINNTGVIRATGTRTVGGHLLLTAGAGTGNISNSGTISAANADGSGGTISVAGGATTGTVDNRGTIAADATNATSAGGQVTVTAANVSLDSGATVSANGGANGGTILLGGDIHGGSVPSQDFSAALLLTAQRTTVAAGATISANGGAGGGSGNGGSVVVWSDEQTNFAGSLTARGGAQSGNGGFAEISSHGVLGLMGSVSLLAPHGTIGSLLLDPADVTITTSADSNDSSTSGGGTSTYNPSSGSDSSNILNTEISTLLASNNVVITTSNSGTQGTPSTYGGSILVNAPISWNSANSLTLAAIGAISVSASITNGGSGGIVLNSDSAGTGSGGITIVGTTSSPVQISSVGGAITMGGGSDPLTGYAVGNSLATGGLDNGPGITLDAAQISSGGGNITMNGQGANTALPGTAQNWGSGIIICDGSTVNSGTGTIAISGLAGDTQSTLRDVGVLLMSTGVLNGTSQAISITSANTTAVAIQITGSAADAPSLNGTNCNMSGIAALSGTSITATGTGGGISLMGTSSGITGNLPFTSGIQLKLGSSDAISTTTGPISLTGLPGSTSSTGINEQTSTTLIGGTSTSGDITLTSDSMTLVNSSIKTTGTLAIQQETAGLPIKTGAVSSPSYLALSSSLSTFTAGNVTIGDTSSGPLTVLLPLTGGSKFAPGTFTLITGSTDTITIAAAVHMNGTVVLNGGGVTESAGITAPDLELVGSGGTFTLGSTNAVGTLAANLGVGAGTITLNNGSTALSFGTVGTATGVTGGTLVLTDSGTVTQTQPINVTNLSLLGGGTFTLSTSTNNVSTFAGSTGAVALTDASPLTINTVSGTNGLTATGAVTLIDDSITPTSSTGLISASGQTVTLQPQTSGTAITLGGTASGFNLTAAQLDYITATTLMLGSDGGVGNASGAISVTASIAPSNISSTLGLLSGSTVGESTHAITIPSLYISSTGATLNGGNAVSTVAVRASGNVSFADTVDLGVGTVNAVYGVQSSGGTVAISTTGALTLASGTGAAVSGVGSGDAVQLADGTTFTNSEGSSAIAVTSGGGSWLVWSQNPANDSLGSLAPGFYQYNATYGTTSPAVTTSNGLLYTLAPTVAENLTGAVSKVYTGTTPAALTSSNYGTVTGAVNSDTVTLTQPASGNYAAADVGTGLTVDVTGIAVASAEHGSTPVYGYQVTSTASGSIGAITAAPLTITANSTSITFGQAIPTNFSSTVSGLQNNESLAQATTGTLMYATTANSSSNAGNYAINASGLSATNYAITYVPGTLTIDPAQLILTIVPNNVSQTYGTAIPTLTGTVSGIPAGQTLASITTGTLTYSTTATQGSNVGTYPITASGLSSTNFTLTYDTGSLAITPAPLTLTASGATMLYGSVLPTLTGALTGFVNGQTALTAGVTGTGSFTTTATPATNVGAYAITPGTGTLSVGGNYTLTTFVPGTLTIRPAPLTIAADSTSITYGQAIPTSFASTVTGLLNGQTLAQATTGTLAIATDATDSSNAGNYTITASGLSATNYAITYVPGTFTIDRSNLTLTITPGNVTQTYGTAIPTLTGTVSGIPAGQTLSSVATGTLVYSTTATPSSNVGVYTITASGLTSTNYNLNYNTGSFTITPATLTYLANPTNDWTYIPIVDLSGSVTGFVLGQDLSNATTGTLTFTTPANADSPAGKYSIYGAGLNAQNYVFAQAPGNASALTLNVPVTPADLTSVDAAITTPSGMVPGMNFGGQPVTLDRFSLAVPPERVTANTSYQVGRLVVTYQSDLAYRADFRGLGLESSFTTFDESDLPSRKAEHNRKEQ